MCSAGLRRGAIPDLRIGDLISIDRYGIYKIKIYAGEPEEYFTYCTPECRKAIDNYIDYRKRLGEKITEHSILFRRIFDEIQVHLPKKIVVKTISASLLTQLNKTGVRTSVKLSKRSSLMETHGFRKFFPLSFLLLVCI
jgi:hypothetical protein